MDVETRGDAEIHRFNLNYPTPSLVSENTLRIYVEASILRQRSVQVASTDRCYMQVARQLSDAHAWFLQASLLRNSEDV